ncbi:MAG TPA: protein kinase [Planctomycetota bacterium]|nr:protein kinase [Planctomycetota bacterium]
MPTNEDLQFGRLAMAQNLVTREELAAALQEQERRRLAEGQAPRLCDALVAMGLLTERQVAQLLSGQSVAGGAGKTLGGYELLSKLGSGGMGTVYKARQTALNRIVALKVLPQRLAKDQDFLARFYREARAVARLNHPNIVGGIDVGEADGYHYLAMEYVDGRSSAAMLADSPAGLPYPRVLDIAIQTAEALEHAHQSGVIHRDIKPENILVSNTDAVKLCDLGLARSAAKDDLSITQAGIAVGTPHYISPEQARGEQKLDLRTDIYSLGASLFHLLSGRTLFSGDNAMQIMLKHLHDPTPLLTEAVPDVPPDFAAVVAKCLAKRPEDRYASAAQLLEDLRLVAAGSRPAHAPPLSAGRSPAPAAGAVRRPATTRVNTAMMRAVAERRRQPARILAVALAVAAALGVGVWLLFFAGKKDSGPDGGHTNGQAARPDPGPEHTQVQDPAANRAKEDFDRAVLYAERCPTEYRRQIELFSKVEKSGGAESVWARLAAKRVRAAEDELRKAVERDLEPVRREAGELKARKEFAAAAARMTRLPENLLGEPLAVAAAEKAAAEIRDAGGAEWESVLAGARKLSEAGDFAGARARIESARPFGLPAVSAGIERELAAVLEAEKVAAALRRRKAEDAFSACHHDLLKLVSSRRYGEAREAAGKVRTELPADLQARVDSDLADVDVVRGVWEQARRRLAAAKKDELFTLTHRTGGSVTGRFATPGDKPFDGSSFLLLRTFGAGESSIGYDFKLADLCTEDVLALAGLTAPAAAAEAERALFFTVFDRTPTPEALQKALGTARMRGVNTARFDALVGGAQVDARDRQAAEELRSLEALVAARRWEEAIAAARRLGETFADTPAYKARAAQVQLWLRQAQEEASAKGRVEVVLQDGQPVPALGLACYAGTRDTSLFSGPERMAGRLPLLRACGGSPAERVLICFDLNAVPRGVTVDAARLELFCKTGPAGGGRMPLRAFRATSGWEEGSRLGTSGAEADGATWRQRGRDSGGAPAPWGEQGGDRDKATDSGKGPGVLDAADVPAAGQWLRLDVTPAVRDCVQGNGRNWGYLLMGDEKAASPAAASFASRESLLQDIERRPRLVLTLRGLNPPPQAPAEVAPTLQDYTLVGNAGAAAFAAAVQLSRGSHATRLTAARISSGTLLLEPNAQPWFLETRRPWGAELEVAVKITLPDGARVAVDLGDKLTDTSARYWAFAHLAADKAVAAGFGTGLDPAAAMPPGAAGVGRPRTPDAALEALLSSGGKYELRFIKQGPRLRLECQGLVLAELVLSPRDEQALAVRPVRLVVQVPEDAAKAAVGARIQGLRLGPVQARPSPPALPEGGG